VLVCPSCDAEIGQVSLIPPASTVAAEGSVYLLVHPRSSHHLVELPPGAWTRALPPPQPGLPTARFGGIELSQTG